MTPAAIVFSLAQVASAEPAAQAQPQPERQPQAEAQPEPHPDLIVPIAHVVTLMTVMRVSEAVIWPDPFARSSLFAAHYGEAFTKPPIFDTSRGAFEWDGDPWYVNTIGHGLFGSELYMRARTCHVPWYGALAFAAASSTLWEYGFEANGVRPSALDLVYTPLAGMLLGEARYVGWTSALGIKSPALRGTVRAVLDPFGELERALGTGC
ncbi:MAG: Ubiquitin-protein ligase [Labilithrix sp.]|nr:Ubiquitin-protein ligase [Labilithrix sp.]